MEKTRFSIILLLDFDALKPSVIQRIENHICSHPFVPQRTNLLPFSSMIIVVDRLDDNLRFVLPTISMLLRLLATSLPGQRHP
jgi:hypothetical protein